MASLQFRNVEKNFGAVKVIHGIGFDIADGEFTVLVGPSGCGKSTLLRMLAGLEEISGGTISIDGLVVNDVESKDRDIAMVFQSYALYPHMTVADNMGFSLKLRKADPKLTADRVAQAAKILNLGPYLHRFPRELSGGQRQRVAMGRAIVRDPKVFLFDEPLSNLDAKLRVAMRAEIKALHQRLKTTTVYVTHDQVEALSLGDRIAVMKQGVILQCDSPLRVYDHPADKFVGGFIGNPPMNFLRGDGLASIGLIAPPGYSMIGIRAENLDSSSWNRLARTTSSPQKWATSSSRSTPGLNSCPSPAQRSGSSPCPTKCAG
ncbi:MAG: ATP-binding cassette domain-containing protein [Burkholderiales bacterium]|nr:ATP-binding cassette domain-containing protein [Burkholderiales bacterium]